MKEFYGGFNRTSNHVCFKCNISFTFRERDIIMNSKGRFVVCPSCFSDNKTDFEFSKVNEDDK